MNIWVADQCPSIGTPHKLGCWLPTVINRFKGKLLEIIKACQMDTLSINAEEVILLGGGVYFINLEALALLSCNALGIGLTNAQHTPTNKEA